MSRTQIGVPKAGQGASSGRGNGSPPGLLGRAFHTTTPESNGTGTDWQGEIIADLGDGYYLAQLFEWIMGGPSTQHVFHIGEFAATHPGEKHKRFRFFDKVEHMNSYYEGHQQRDPFED